MKLGTFVALLSTACSFTGGAPSDATPIDLALDDPAVIDAPRDAMADALDAGGGCLDTFCYRKPITVEPTLVIGGQNLTDFTMLVDLPTDAELALHARPDGHDIKFVANGTDLAYERVAWNETTGRLLAWVRVPVLSATARTTIYLVYGNPGFAADSQRPTDAWEPSYKGVWHLEETVGGTAALQDATANGNDATDVANPAVGAAGIIGRAVAFDGVNDRVRMPNSASLDAVAGAGTISLWINYVNARPNRYQLILSTGNRYTNDDGFEWATQDSGQNSGHYFYPRGSASNYNLGAHTFTDGTWHHAAVVFDRLGTSTTTPRSVQIFIDGLPIAFTVQNVPTSWTQNAVLTDWLWGASPDVGATNYAFAGLMDELRVTTAVRTQGFLQTEARNQRVPTTFSQLGLQELTP